MCNQYRQDKGSFPPENSWSRELTLFFTGDSDFVQFAEFRDIVESFYDGWGKPMRYRYPGVLNPEGFDIYSFGPNGRDEGGKNEDISNR
jgi:Type II secretion system (T2SS), protein G